MGARLVWGLILVVGCGSKDDTADTGATDSTATSTAATGTGTGATGTGTGTAATGSGTGATGTGTGATGTGTGATGTGTGATGTGTGATGTGTGATGTGSGSVPLRLVGDPAELPAAGILSVWGTGADDVYLTGSDDGSGPVVLHYDGADWSRLDTGTTGDLWWAWGDGVDTVWFSGEGGRVVRHTLSTGAFVQSTITDPAIKLYGMWGAGPDDVWAVGGDPSGSLPGVMVHFDGATWTERGTAPDAPAGGTRQSFKVWGAASDDVWVVGTSALLMHWTGAQWDELTAPVYPTIPLITVHGSGAEAYGVGGFGNAAVIRLDSGTWADDSPPPVAIAPFFNGVFVDDTAGVVACGGKGQLWWRHPVDGWARDPRPSVTTADLHACWIDDEDGLWAVGGDLVGLTSGAVLYAGPSPVPEISL